FFTDTATTEIYTLSLHDALPISTSSTESESVIEIQRALIPESGRLVLPLPSLGGVTAGLVAQVRRVDGGSDWLSTDNRAQLLLRSEEHTSELQSRENLVCRLLLE